MTGPDGGGAADLAAVSDPVAAELYRAGDRLADRLQRANRADWPSIIAGVPVAVAFSAAQRLEDRAAAAAYGAAYLRGYVPECRGLVASGVAFRAKMAVRRLLGGAR